MFSHSSLAVILAAAMPVAFADTCPDGSLSTKYNGVERCCPGDFTQEMNGGEEAFSGCVAGCTKENNPCWPIDCPDEPMQLTSGICTSAAFTASDYTQKLYGDATTTKESSAPTHTPFVSVTPSSGPTPTSTTKDASATGGNSSGEDGDDGSSSSDTNTDDGSSQSSEGGADGADGSSQSSTETTTDQPGAAPRITNAPVLALAGGIVGLAALI